MGKRIWTEEVLRNVTLLLRDGYSLMELADMHGVSYVAFRMALRRHGIDYSNASRAKFWNKTRLDEIQRLRMLGHTCQEIADHFGVPLGRIKKVISASGLGRSSIGRRNAAERWRGRRHTKEARAKMSAATSERFRDPEERRKQSERCKSRDMRAIGKLGNDAQRGWSVPDEDWVKYRHLTVSKKFKAREAGAILGHIPHDQNRSV